MARTSSRLVSASTTRAVCVQLPVDHGARDAIVGFNERRAQLDELGRLPKVTPRAQFSGLGGNTLNLFMRSVLQRLPAAKREDGEDGGPVDPAGKLCIEILRGMDGAFATAAEQGYPAIILSTRSAPKKDGRWRLYDVPKTPPMHRGGWSPTCSWSSGCVV